MRNRRIDNNELRLEVIPQNPSFKEWWDFAHLFDLKNAAETFEETGNLANKTRQAIQSGETEILTLTELRNALYFYARAIRHTGADPDEKYINELLDLIRNRVERKRLD